MTHYSENSESCRVDFFKSSGKWYCTEAVVFPGHVHSKHPVDALKMSLAVHLKGRLDGMRAVCLQPAVAMPFPVMVEINFSKWVVESSLENLEQPHA